MKRWEVEGTDEFAEWYRSLDDDTLDAVDAAIEKLVELGPMLGRPFVAEISLSPDYRRHIPTFGNHLKELRPMGQTNRVLFTFDPRRTAILLVGGDKVNDWKRWYRQNIPVAADLYTTYLADLHREGLL